MNSSGERFSSIWLGEALGLSGDVTPFPWQEKLLRLLAQGSIPPSLDIPTGLGKTSVMAIWLVARGACASVPRRLVYVVDRRAVVDQATEVALQLREYVERNTELKQALGLRDRALPISTLRGQHVDNKEWLEDPASPAIIVGTIDMIGSRLLFEGYRVSRKMRPYHAGLLGADTLVVLDEAHLVPPFEKLIETISEGRQQYGPTDDGLRGIIPELKLLTLSATGRSHVGHSFGLEEEDLQHRVVKRRLEAPKRLTLVDLESEQTLEVALAEQAWRLSGEGSKGIRCLVFCDRRETAAATMQAIETLAKGDKSAGRQAVEVDTDLFVGGRRIFEREEAAKRLKELGFIAGTTVKAARPTFVCATSAGEVGVDLDADHMVSDLVPWERMVQRLGRVNRRGDGDADVIVLVEPPSKDAEKAEKKEREEKDLTVKEAAALETSRRRAAVRKVVNRLPQGDGGARSVSLEAIRELRLQAQCDEALQKLLDDATTPAPLRPALTRALVDAWSMTSLKEHTGRPEVGPWLRGWIRDDPPQTTVIWRRRLPVRASGLKVSDREIETFFEAAPPHASEALETETHRVLDWLLARAKAVSEAAARLPAAPPEQEPEGGQHGPLQARDVAAIALSAAGDLRRVLRLNDLVPQDGDKKGLTEMKEQLRTSLAGATLIVDVRMGGLVDGLLDHKRVGAPRAADDGEPWLVDAAGAGSEPPPVRFRVRAVEPGQSLPADPAWRERVRFATGLSADGEPARWIVVEKWRHDAATEEDRSAAHPQLLHDHQRWTLKRAVGLGRRLGLAREYRRMLAVAALLHDEGKRGRWQRAFNAPPDGPYAKTKGPINYALLDGYRHEFGSLPVAAGDSRLAHLDGELQNLALHLIAAHHGFARPNIATRGCEDAPPSCLEGRARVVALRFARLQKRWGPWGLAWWEALLRAADQQASRANDAV